MLITMNENIESREIDWERHRETETKREKERQTGRGTERGKPYNSQSYIISFY